MPNELSVATAVKNQFPKLQIAVITGELPATTPDPARTSAAINALRDTALRQLKTEAGRFEHLSQHPHVAAWRQAYASFGVKAKRHPPTHEALAKRLLKDQGWPEINPIVDIYLANQAQWLLPHGGYDSDYLSGDLCLRLAGSGLTFTALGSDEAEAVPEGEIIYTDEARVLTRRWNYRDCHATRIRAATQRFWLAIESPDSALIAPDIIRQAGASLADKLDRTLGASVALSVIG